MSYPESITQLKPHELYLSQMIDVKRRFRAAERILGAKKPLTGNIDIDNECVFLQTRRIIELITFSAIVSDERRYQQSRILDAEVNPRDKGDYTTDWKATDILIRLSKISPYFLPRPLGDMSVQQDGTKHFNATAAKLTHDRLISIYKTASGFVHTSNPFKSNIASQERQKVVGTRETIIKELSFLKSVIWMHAKIGLEWNPGSDPKQIDNGETAWLIWFGDIGTDKISMSLATAVKQD